jgi:molybdopterin-guanine dinucleotide biosynthesis protein A
MNMAQSERDLTAGLIVAGGASRRFGHDKARHPIDGVPMIARVHDALAAVTHPVVVSVGPDAASYADVLPEDTQHVHDQHENAGPLAGLEAGFRALSADWVLVAACDMPHVTPDGFRALLTARNASADAIVARSEDGRRHPLFACYQRTQALDAIQHNLSEGTLALHALLDRLAVREVAVASRVVHNVNRPRDLGDA